MDDSFDLRAFQLKEHFKSKKEVLSQDKIYVYCPPELAKTIGIIVDDYSFDIIVNDYSVTDFTKKVVCHYQSSDLNKNQRQFLVKATEFELGLNPWLAI